MNTQAILDVAKETILEQGNHAPTIYAEDTEGHLALFSLTFLPETTFEKQKLMFRLGRDHGKTCHPDHIASVTFVTEAWTSTVRIGEKRKYRMPSEDPNRKEVLLLLSLDCQSGQSVMQQVRDGSGKLVDLLALPREVDGVHDHMLPYFLAGIASAKLSDKELERMYKRIEKGLR